MSDVVVVKTGKESHKISRDIYGHFSEHLGRCIYGGFWVGKDSEIPNINGYRKDVIEAFKEIGIPNIRWPGGCFADTYHWKDGIGPNENRKKMINTHWGGVVEDNSFGTHEFLDMCELLDCKPYISGNVGSGTVQEMAEWVEYITFGGESPMSKLREQNGRKEPWKLPLFGVGNESWGCGGNMRPEYYADLYRHYQTYVRQYGADKIFKIACGPSGGDYNWTEVLMKNAAYYMDGLSMHFYTVHPSFENKNRALEFNEKDWYGMLSNCNSIEEIIQKHSDIMDKYDPEKRIALVVDEWGTWHEVEEGTNPGFLYQQNCVRDALVAGLTLNIFNNHSDRVRIANIAQAVNVLQSPVLTEGKKMVKTPTWYIFKMYKDHHDADFLESFVSTDEVSFEDSPKVNAISSSASHKENVYTITLTNADLQSKRSVKIMLHELKNKIKSAKASVVTGEKMNSYNSFDNPDQVIEKELKVSVCGDSEIEVELPAMCVAKVTVEI